MTEAALTLCGGGVSVWRKSRAKAPRNDIKETSRMARWPFFALFLAAALAIPMASASAQPEIRISRTTTMAYLPLMLVEAEKLLQKHAAAAGILDLKVSIHTFTGPSAQFDALFSGNVDVVAVGSTALITLWAKTKGTCQRGEGRFGDEQHADRAQHAKSAGEVHPRLHRQGPDRGAVGERLVPGDAAGNGRRQGMGARRITRSSTLSPSASGRWMRSPRWRSRTTR